MKIIKYILFFANIFLLTCGGIFILKEVNNAAMQLLLTFIILSFGLVNLLLINEIKWEDIIFISAEGLLIFLMIYVIIPRIL